jgi:acyl-CoA-binding protein
VPKAAAAHVKANHKSAGMSNSVLLNLYGLYKRSTEGACNIAKPSVTNVQASQRYSAWRQCSRLSEGEAMRAYVLAVRCVLQPPWVSCVTLTGGSAVMPT